VLPTGTVSLLFTDIEGSTELLKQLGDQAYAEALSRHAALMREAFRREDGTEAASSWREEAALRSNAAKTQEGGEATPATPPLWLRGSFRSKHAARRRSRSYQSASKAP